MNVKASANGKGKGEQARNAEMGETMVGRNGWVVLRSQRGAGQAKGTEQAATEVREGTTGQIVSTVARIWAVADGSAERVPGATPKVEERRPRALPDVEVRFYRKYTEALLRRYVQMTMEAGRVPSLMGREVLGGRASSYRIHGFDDAVNFRLDVEKCLGKLDAAERDALRRVAMQEYTQAEAAPLLGVSLRTCVDRYGRSLDRLTAMLLEVRLLEPFRALSRGGM